MGGKTVAIIGARLTSTRLPRKQLLPLAGVSLITHIARRLRKVEAIDEIIVATTADHANQDLCDWAEQNGVTGFAWDGDENDVVGRVDAAFRAAKADRFVYVCGDCPFIEPDTIAALIEVSVAVSPFGMARARPPKGAGKLIHEGFDVFNRGFWDRMVAVAKEPFEREHIGAVYFHLNKVKPDQLVWIEDDAKFAEVEHRLSVDTPQDYAFASKVYDRWYRSNNPNSIVDLKWVIDQLVHDQDLAAINAHVRQKTVKEVATEVVILCEAGPGIGLGHLSRACAAANSLQEHLGAAVQIQVRGPKVEFSGLDLLPHEWVNRFSLDGKPYDCIVTDVKLLDQELSSLLEIRSKECLTVGIDEWSDPDGLFNLLWVPAVHVETDHMSPSERERLHFGLDTFLLRRPDHGTDSLNSGRADRSVIVLTGGADPLGLSASLPQQLLAALPQDTQIDWVQGPYAADPNVLDQNERFICLKSPPDLYKLVAGCDAALCVFGVTFYECLRVGVPAIVFDPLGAASKEEWAKLETMFPSLVAPDVDAAIQRLCGQIGEGHTLNIDEIVSRLSSGPRNFAHAIQDGLKSLKEVSDAAA